MKPDTLIYFYILGVDGIFSKTEDEFFYVKNNPIYRALNQEQTAYLLAHPDATLGEVLACLEPPTFDLELYKKKVVEKLDFESLERLNELIPDYKIKNAEISLLATNEGVYSSEYSQNLIAKANRISILLRNERYRIYELIQSFSSKEEVDNAFNLRRFKDIVE